MDVEAVLFPPGTAVVVGPAGSDDSDVCRALAELADLTGRHGELVAGAAIALGEGFHSARLDGGAGTRRDAVLAALRALRDPARLGDRATVGAALFGPAVTRTVGAAANQAIHDGRWPALHLATAVSDLLGPEQLAQVLALTGVEDLPLGPPSILAGHLRHVLGPLTAPRRLRVLLDLWSVVATRQEDDRKIRRRAAMRGSDERAVAVGERCARFVDDRTVERVRLDLGRDAEPTVAEAARWSPESSDWQHFLQAAIHDALAATVLVRAAVAVADHGLASGLGLVRHEIAAAATLMSASAEGKAAAPGPGLLGVPARPGVYVRQLDAKLRPGAPMNASTDNYVRRRLGYARGYGEAARVTLDDLLHRIWQAPVHIRQDWGQTELRRYREAVGYTAVRPPTTWRQQPLGGGPALAERLGDTSNADATVDTLADAERPEDLLWWAELSDALAQLDGLEQAYVITYGSYPHLGVVDEETDPLRPGDRSITLAVAGAAQLVSLGAQVPAAARTWGQLVDGLRTAASVAEAMVGSFPAPDGLRHWDGRTLPGTDARVEVALGPRQLATWAAYMGNCIAGRNYLDEALAGRCALLALWRDGRIVANVELGRGRHGRWNVVCCLGRFNDDPDPALSEPLRAWTATLRRGGPAQDSDNAIRPAIPAVDGGDAPARSGARHDRGQRLLAGTGLRLASLARESLDQPDMTQALAMLTGEPSLAGVTALRGTDAARLDQLVRDTPDLAALWRATAMRPLTDALTALGQGSADAPRNPDSPPRPNSSSNLGLLLVDGPLPNTLRRLARLPGVAEARDLELVARRIRGAIGRLACADDPALALAVRRRATTGLLCALVLTITSSAPAIRLTVVVEGGDVRVPGYPLSTLDDADGPWVRTRPDAAELGARFAGSPHRSERPLVVPTSWLGRGRWPALWQRAASRTGPVHPTR